MSDREYPHWSVVWEDDKIANLWCAVKYVAWHAMFALMAVFGIILVGSAMVLDKILSTTSSSRVAAAMKSDLAIKIGWLAFYAAGACIALFLAATVGFMAFTDPVMFVASIATAAGVIVGFILLFIVWDKIRPYLARLFGTASSKAVQTPGVRRIYGNCPVSLDIEPKWFGNLFDRGD